MKTGINLYIIARNPQNARDSECIVIVHTIANQRVRVCAAGTASTVDYTMTITPRVMRQLLSRLVFSLPRLSC